MNTTTQELIDLTNTVKEALTNKARASVEQMATDALVEAFEQTSNHVTFTYEEHELDTIIRGWIMDELEARNPEAFWTWIDSVTDSPRAFFLS